MWFDDFGVLLEVRLSYPLASDMTRILLLFVKYFKIMVG